MLVSNSPSSVLMFRNKLIVELVEKGISVVVLIPSNSTSSKIVEDIKSLGCEVDCFPLNRAGVNICDDMKTCLSLYFLVLKHKPTHVLNYTIKPVIYNSIAAKFAGVKNIYGLITGVGYAFISLDDQTNKITILQKIVFNLYKVALYFCKEVIFQNSDDASLFRDMKLVDPEKINIVNGSGVDLSFYNYDISLLEDYTSAQPLKFLMLGRIIGDKGIHEYIGAAKELKKKYGGKVVFQLGGGLDTNPTAISKEELDEWINTGIIEYLGKLKDVRPAITNSHIFILPSYREGTSRSILEAMSIGRPIVTTNVPGCKQLVIENINGYLSEPKSIGSLVEAIEKILQLSPIELSKMGCNSRKIVEEKYDVSKVNKHMLDIMGIK